MTSALFPEPTHLAESDSRLHIPAARLPTEPTEAEVTLCEAKLEQTWRDVHAAQIILAEAATESAVTVAPKGA